MIEFLEADQAILDVIKRHGALPSHYLYALTKHHRKNYTGFSKRLKRLMEAGYLRLPRALNHPDIHNDYLVYDSMEANDHSDYVHALMAGTVTSNVEIGTLQTTIQYSDFGRVSFPTHLKYPITPDAAFALHYGKSRSFFVIEADRGTESIKTIIKAKLRAYDHVLTNATYEVHNLPQPWIIFVTTSQQRMENMMKQTQELFPGGSKRILFTWIPGFFPYHRTPPLFPQLFGEYQRVGYEPLDISKP